jgi:hypothetical protein
MGWMNAQLWFHSQYGHEFCSLQNTRAGSGARHLAQFARPPLSGQGMKLTTHVDLVQRWRMHGTKSPLHYMPLKHAQEQFHLYLSQENSIQL